MTTYFPTHPGTGNQTRRLHARRIRRGSFLCLLVLLLASCKHGETNSKYSNFRTRLTIDNVMRAPVLYTACESMGEFCSITSDGSHFFFTNAAGTSSRIDIMAENSYSGYTMGLNSGYIVGRLSIPEIGENEVRVVCFDRACPNCYQNYNITKPLTLQTGGYARCAKCLRTYNLNDCGTLSDGPSGRNLFRYRVSYYSDRGVLSINN